MEQQDGGRRRGKDEEGERGSGLDSLVVDTVEANMEGRQTWMGWRHEVVGLEEKVGW